MYKIEYGHINYGEIENTPEEEFKNNIIKYLENVKIKQKN